jgi:hypothetical protein
MQFLQYSMSKHLRVGGIGAVAVMLALAMMVAPAMAAAPTVDTETTDTSTTSDWTDNTNVTDFDANASNSSYLEASFDSQNASIEIVDPETGTVHAMNDSDAMQQTAALDTDTSGTNDTWYYAWDLSHDELGTVPMDANESKAITVRFIDDTTLSNPNVTEITVYLENQDDRAVVYAGDAAADGGVSGLDLSTSMNEPWLGVFGNTEASTTIEANSVGLGPNPNATDVTVIAANTSNEDPFEQALSKSYGSYSDGAFVPNHQLVINENKHAVFNNEAPEGVLDGATYAHTTTVDGHDAYMVSIGEDYSNESSVDMTTKANKEYGWFGGMVAEDRALGGLFENGMPITTGFGAGQLTAGA